MVHDYAVDRSGTDDRGTTSGVGVDDDELAPVTEVVRDLDVVEREGSNGESDTGVLTEEERERKGEVATTEGRE